VVLIEEKKEPAETKTKKTLEKKKKKMHTNRTRE
jgi:hypothetical protein